MTVTGLKLQFWALINLIHTMPHIISEADNVALTAITTAQEIKAAVFLLNADSSPGPDGFTGFFFHHCWEIVEYDVVITKILASRLSPLAERIISKEQYGFIPNRNSQQAIGLASELINELKAPRRGGSIAIKIDISQAFDIMDWEFLWAVLQQLGFSGTWIQWIKGAFTTNSLSIMLNGVPQGHFTAQRGLKQGDPLSPLLFALAEDCLSRNISHMVREKKILPMVVNAKYSSPSHLMFADDMFIFSNANLRSIKNLVKILSSIEDSLTGSL
ncbi:hypothetical protein IFM89_009618 [Coptis chinensis]|uniref:Reverse transcriptase domain-containing protein n=1 Tax=Coptis chinensis TaxID=261450 RepID=A0A835ISK8_9MAGN|nr:hypothetical protein IFM89_009618 [Coptis chinensis]